MSSRVVKWLLLASVLLLAFPVAAMASPSRVDGLGIQGDYIKDYTNVYSYLSNICCVGNLVYGELGNWYSDSETYDHSMGMFLNTGQYGTFGIHLREEIGQLGQADANTPVDADWAWDINYNESHSFDLMWGKKFGAMSLGVRFNRAYIHGEGDTLYMYDGPAGYLKEMDGYRDSYYWIWDGLDTDYSIPIHHGNVMGIGVGFGFEASPTLNLEAGFNYQGRKFSSTDTAWAGVDTLYGTKWESDGANAYMLSLRGLWQARPNLLVIPVFKYYSMETNMKWSWEDHLESANIPTTAYEHKQSGWQIGAAANWTLNQNDLLVLGATFGKTTYEFKQNDFAAWYDGEEGTYHDSVFVAYDLETNDTYMPILFGALETHVNPWLTLRFGAQQGAIYSSEFEGVDANYSVSDPYDYRQAKQDYSWFSLNLGAGVKLGTLQLDATLNESFVHNGLYFLSGSSTSYLFPKVSATYTF